MTELERRALLGDREAQEECTRRGIVLPCPCGGHARFVQEDTYDTYFHSSKVYIVCEECGCFSAMSLYGNDGTLNPNEYTKEGEDKAKERSLKLWNTRIATPVGQFPFANDPFFMVAMGFDARIGTELFGTDESEYTQPKPGYYEEADHGQE